ncbi:MAG: pyruvate kinase [Acidobacteriota bacterium]
MPKLEPSNPSHLGPHARSTKIVVTLGPATDDPARLAELFDAGANVFRLNASHGNWPERLRRLEAVRTMAKQKGAHVAILLDLQGPKIRLGNFAGGCCTLEPGTTFTITTSASAQSVLGDVHGASTTYADFAKDVKPGDRVLLADGSVELKALSSDGVSVVCEVVCGGPISDHKGINLPGVALSTPSLTAKDIEDLKYGLEAGIDLVALSFVRKAADVEHLRTLLNEMTPAGGTQVPLIAKIEKPEGWENLDAILDASDGVMVARGDLGVEMPMEQVPFIQKRIIQKARDKGKFVITATQMLESMIHERTPTRAEVSDVANAICDGSDALMLSAETSVGCDPGQAVRTMARVAEETETWLRPEAFRHSPARSNPTNAEIIADAVLHAAQSAGVAAIAVYTRTGLGARLISRQHPPVPIYAFTPDEVVARQLAPWFGVIPIMSPALQTTDQKLQHLEADLVAKGLLKVGDNVVFVAGQPRGPVSGIDLIKLHRLEG